jgi:hypothetical protein
MSENQSARQLGPSARSSRPPDQQDVMFMLVDLAGEDEPVESAVESIDDYLHQHMDELFLASYSEAFSGDSFERPTRELTKAETVAFFRDIGSAHAGAQAERAIPGFDARWAAVWSTVDALLDRDRPVGHR